MRLTVMSNMAKSLRSPPPDLDLPSSPPVDLATDISTQLESLKWFLWHGNTFRADQVLDDLQVDLDTEESGPEQSKLAKHLAEFAGYILANADRIPNYGERRRCGETISTAFVESTVNQVVSKRMVKKTTDALVTAGHPPVPPGPRPSPQRRPGRRLRPLASQLHSSQRTRRARGVGITTGRTSSS